MDLIVDQFICRTDNYGILIHDRESGQTATIDAPDSDAVLARLSKRGWGLDFICVTHHHRDHTSGNLALKRATGCSIIGPAKEADQIPGMSRAVSDGDHIELGRHRFEVVDTPGHTFGHIAYWWPGQRMVFVGDTLFSLGCGRVTDGRMPQMWASLAKLAKLPRETLLYCGHEYTESNSRFAITVEPSNLDLQARVKEVRSLQARGEMTLPTTVGLELATNPFFRADKPRLQRAVGMADADPVEVFSVLRRRKDTFV